MGRKGNEDFDWLDDPFDEKKTAREQAQATTSGGTKLAIGCGCLLAVVAVVVLLIFAGASALDILSDL